MNYQAEAEAQLKVLIDTIRAWVEETSPEPAVHFRGQRAPSIDHAPPAKFARAAAQEMLEEAGADGLGGCLLCQG
jgi:hypothetical protein